MRTKFLAIFVCMSILHLAGVVEAKDDGGYSVVYDGGSLPGLKTGKKLSCTSRLTRFVS